MCAGSSSASALTTPREAAKALHYELGSAHEALGEALAEAGDKAGARRELERALALDPSLDGARDRLKKMRWSFLA